MGDLSRAGVSPLRKVGCWVYVVLVCLLFTMRVQSARTSKLRNGSGFGGYDDPESTKLPQTSLF